MKLKRKPHAGLHLVTAEEAASLAVAAEPTPCAEPAEQEMDAWLAQGIRRYRELQKEVDRELFGDQDQEKLIALLPELQLLRERLNAYGIRVRQDI